MIILEGNDKSGKSILAKKLSQQLSWSIKKFSQPKTTDPYHEYLDFLLNTKVPYILDRFLVGEFVYPIVYNRRTMMTRRHFRTIEMMLKTLDSSIVYTNSYPMTIKRKFVEDKEKFNKVKDVKLTSKLYDVYFDEISHYNPIKYNYELPNSDDVIDDVVRAYDDYEKDFKDKMWLLHEGYQGCSNKPDILFVGEIVNVAGRVRNARPFDLNGSSDVLFDMIDRVNKNKSTFNQCKNFGIVNAMKPDYEHTILPKIKKLVKPRKIVALGGEAWKFVVRLNTFNKYEISHPGYIKRFLIPINEYMKELTNIIKKDDHFKSKHR